MATSDAFETGYKGLNPAQRLAVDTIDGPVMVIAGPGTGKTQILALRIANILLQTDTTPDGILCLTFTNSGVRAMQERLRSYVGATASRVQIATFHSFGMKLLEEFYTYLDFDPPAPDQSGGRAGEPPRLLDDLQSVALVDEILHTHDWKHIRSRANPALYFGDIKSLVSVLKRERISPQQFLCEIEDEVEKIEQDPESISSRGPTKGKMKQEAIKAIEGLNRTRELVTFYELYEALKRDRNLLDYDDVLARAVELVETSEDARSTIRERYLYALVDEHQDSSGVQNEFLRLVWGDIEKPNVFVVGDDRQLIYGFGGASLSHFQGFMDTFPGTQVFTLTENYRSTQVILDSAEQLLQSSLASAKLVGNRTGTARVGLVECDYPRDEIIAAGIAIRERIASGVDANECAILVPKNAQAKSAMRVLADLGIPVAAGGALKLFEVTETQSLLSVLQSLANPFAPEYIAPLLLDSLSGIPPLVAHEYLSQNQAKKLTLAKLLESDVDEIKTWAEKLQSWLECSAANSVYALVQMIGDELLLRPSQNHEQLTRRVEVVRTMLHLILSQAEKVDAGKKLELADFLAFIVRLQEYGTDIPLAVFAADQGVKVMTLHSSKGLEFESVWIAHLDEKSLAGKRTASFTLPESIKEKLEEQDELVIKRKLYVAMTRAKDYCVLSYARHGYTGGEQRLANVVADLPADTFDRTTLGQSEDLIRQYDIKAYVVAEKSETKNVTLDELTELVAEQYAQRNVSVSALNNFFECPWKWYFRNLLQLPEPGSVSMQFGNIIHTTIEKILKQRIVPNAEQLRDMIAENANSQPTLDERESERLQAEAHGILSRWVSERLPDIASEYESEKAFYNFHDAEFEHLKITGKIDLLEKLDEVSVRVTDFKTGKPKTKNDIEKEQEEDRMSDYLRQLAMYSYLLAGKSFDVVDVTESRLEFVEAELADKNAIYATKITSDQIQSLRDDIRDYDKALKSGKWIGRECHFKSYGKATAECQYCALAKMYTEVKGISLPS
jgi:DNA helicase II / ATP-dependent DNA helicase PcrA